MNIREWEVLENANYGVYRKEYLDWMGEPSNRVNCESWVDCHNRQP